MGRLDDVGRSAEETSITAEFDGYEVSAELWFNPGLDAFAWTFGYENPVWETEYKRHGTQADKKHSDYGPTGTYFSDIYHTIQKQVLSATTAIMVYADTVFATGYRVGAALSSLFEKDVNSSQTFRQLDAVNYTFGSPGHSGVMDTTDKQFNILYSEDDIESYSVHDRDAVQMWHGIVEIGIKFAFGAFSPSALAVAVTEVVISELQRDGALARRLQREEDAVEDGILSADELRRQLEGMVQNDEEALLEWLKDRNFGSLEETLQVAGGVGVDEHLEHGAYALKDLKATAEAWGIESPEDLDDLFNGSGDAKRVLSNAGKDLASAAVLKFFEDLGIAPNPDFVESGGFVKNILPGPAIRFFGNTDFWEVNAWDGVVDLDFYASVIKAFASIDHQVAGVEGVADGIAFFDTSLPLFQVPLDRTDDVDVGYFVNPGVNFASPADWNFISEAKGAQGGQFRDIIFATAVPGAIYGGNNPHLLEQVRYEGNEGDDIIIGSSGMELIDAGVGENIVLSRAGDDVLVLSNGSVSGDLGDGDDILVIGSGLDYGMSLVSGGEGQDTIIFGMKEPESAALSYYRHTDEAVSWDHSRSPFADFESVEGGQGDDAIIGGNEAERITGHSGDDRLRGGNGDDVLEGGRGDDVLIVGGSLGSSAIGYGGSMGQGIPGLYVGADRLFGGEDDDLFLLDRGQEHQGVFHEVDGGSGDDTVGFVTGVSGVTIDLGTDAFRSIENVLGTDGADILLGDEHQNILIGGGGADHLMAGSDEDVLRGGDGDDIFAGKGAVIAGEVSGGEGHDALLLGAQAPRSSERTGLDQSDLDRGRSDSGMSFDLGERSSVLGLEILGRKYTGIETVVGTRHSDTISGDDAGNSLETGGGSDTLTGRAGGDTYHVWRNQSSEPEIIRISEQGAPDDVDGLVVEYASSEVSYRVPPDSNDLEVILGDGEQTIVIEGQYDDDLRNRIENIRFADGETKALPRKLIAGDEDYLTGDDFVFEITLAVIGEHTTESMPPRLKVFAQADDGSWAHEPHEYELADLTRVSPEDASSPPYGDRHTVTYSVSNERTFKKLYFEIVNGSSAAVAIYSILVNENLVTPETEGWHHLVEGAEEALELTHWIVGLDTPGLIDVDTQEPDHEVRDTTERADTVVVREYSSTNVTVDVGSGDDRVRTRDGDDYVVGGSGRDYIWTGGGNDTIVADDDDAVIDGGDGYDLLIMQGYGDKFLDLTVLRVEEVRAGAGNDIVDGRGRSVDLTIDGEAGDDLIYGGSGADTIRGGEGVDEIYGLAGADVIHGGVGGDRIQGGLDADIIHGDAGDDSLLGGQGDDTIEGGAGADVIGGGLGSDTLGGGEGADLLTGGDESDSLSGGAGSDTLYGDGGNDTLEGGDGDDTLHGGIGDDALAGGDEADTLHGEAGEDALTGGAGDDRLFGGDEADRLVGGVGADELHGGAGDDTLVIDAQDTSVSGGAGFDTVEVEWREDREGVSLDLAAGEIEKIVSTGGDDVLDARGATWAVDIDGGWGQDKIFGGSGADRLTFGYGAEVRGGQGDDTYVAEGLDGNLRDTGGFDTILADGHLTRDDFSFLRVGSALVVVAETGFAHGTLKIEGHFDGGAVEQLQFGDGGSVIDLTAADLVPDGSVFGQDGDTLVGTAASDTIQVDDGISSKYAGGAGDDMFRIGYEPRDSWGYGEYHFGDVEVNGGEGTDTLAVNVVDDDWYEVWKRYIRNGDDLSIEFMGAADGSVSLPEFFANDCDGLEVIDIEVHDSFGFNYQNETIDLTDRENLPKVWNLLSADGPTGEVVGTESGDLLRASESQTDLYVDVGGGDDEVRTGAGDDVVTGGPGSDRIYSGAGNDVLDLGSGNDRADLGTGDDFVHMGDGDDSVFATYNDQGSNTFYMGGGEDYVRAGDGDDLIVFGMGRSSARGRAGDDTYSIGSSEDHSVFDTGGHDRLVFRHLGRGDLEEVGFERTGHNDRSLVISHAGANVATVSFWFYQNEYWEQDYSKIETLELGDGSEFNLLELQRLYEEEGTLANANPLDPAA